MNGYSINDQIACIVERNKGTPVKQYHNYKNSFLKPTDNQLLNEINNNLLNPKQPTPQAGVGTQQAFSQPDRTEYIRNIQEAGTRLREAEDRVRAKEKEQQEAIKKSDQVSKALSGMKSRTKALKDFREHINDLWINHFKDNEESILSGKPIEAKAKKKALTKGVNSFDFEGKGFPPLRVESAKDLDSKDRRRKTEKLVNEGANRKVEEINQRKGNLVNSLVDKIIKDGYNKNHNHKRISDSDVKKTSKDFINNLEDLDDKMKENVKREYKKATSRLESVKNVFGENLKEIRKDTADKRTKERIEGMKKVKPEKVKKGKEDL
tara:strand:- start:2694 stop:3659 length:966 start_codon:yes stop_codon:yes gene_type:complete